MDKVDAFKTSADILDNQVTYLREGYSELQVTEMIELGQKSKINPVKSLKLPTKPQNILEQRLTPTESHAEFPRFGNFQKGLNDITRKTNPLWFSVNTKPDYKCTTIPRCDITHQKLYEKYYPKCQFSRNQTFT